MGVELKSLNIFSDEGDTMLMGSSKESDFSNKLLKVEQLKKQYTINQFSLEWLKFEEVYQWMHLTGNSLTRTEMAAILDTMLIINDKPFDDYCKLISYNRVINYLKCSDSLDIAPEVIADFKNDIFLDPNDSPEVIMGVVVPFDAEEICNSFNQSQKKLEDILDFCIKLYELKPYHKCLETVVRIVMNYLLLGNGYILCTQTETTKFDETFKIAAVDNLIERYEFFIEHRSKGKK